MQENGQIYILAALTLPPPRPSPKKDHQSPLNRTPIGHVQCAKGSKEKYL